MWPQSSDNVIWKCTLHLSFELIYTTQLSNMLTRFHSNNFIVLIPSRSAVELPPNPNACRHCDARSGITVWINLVYVYTFILNKICFSHPELLVLTASHDLFVKIISYEIKAMYEIAPSINGIFLRSTLCSSVWNTYIPTTYSVIFMRYFATWNVVSSLSKLNNRV